jgi:hypothetical protein
VFSTKLSRNAQTPRSCCRGKFRSHSLDVSSSYMASDIVRERWQSTRLAGKSSGQRWRDISGKHSQKQSKVEVPADHSTGDCAVRRPLRRYGPDFQDISVSYCNSAFLCNLRGGFIVPLAGKVGPTTPSRGGGSGHLAYMADDSVPTARAFVTSVIG